MKRRYVPAVLAGILLVALTAGSMLERSDARRHRVEGKLHYLIGSERELRPVWRAFHVLPALDSGDADTHSASVRIFNPAAEWVSTLHPGVDLTPGNLAKDALAAGEMTR